MPSSPLELLAFGFVALPYAVVIALAFGLLILLLGLYRSPIVGILLVLALAVWEGAAYGLPSFKLLISWSPLDIGVGCIGLIAVLRLLFVQGALSGVPNLLFIVVAAMLISFGRGVISYGTAAGVQFRGDFYFWFICLYLLSFEVNRTWLDRLLTYWTVAAFLLCLVIWYRWAADSFGLNWVEPVWRDGGGIVLEFRRVAPSSVALFLSLALLISISRLASGLASALHYPLVPALVLTIVLLQHRSAWAASFLPMMWLLLRARSKGRQKTHGPILVTVVAIVIVGGVLGSGRFATVSDSVTGQAERATSTHGGTFVARTNSWRNLIQQWSDKGVVVLALGEPYGSVLSRRESETWGSAEVTYAPHNYYIWLLLRVGLVGAAAFCLLLWRAWSWSGQSGKARDGIDRPCASAILMSLMLYWIPYGTTFESSLLFATVLCCAREALKSPRTKLLPAALESDDDLERLTSRNWTEAGHSSHPRV